MKTSKIRYFVFGLIAVILVSFVALSLAGCPDGRNNNGGNPGTDPTGTPVKTLTGITAVYVPTTEIFPDTKHDTLKEGLTVKAAYSDNTGKTLADSDYTLSGTLAVGESAITVSYTEGGVTKTAAFKVTVDALTHAHNWQFKEVKTSATCTEAGEELWECAVISPPHHEDRETAALGHNWQFKEVKTPATCTTTGEDVWECAVISPPHHEDRETAALGHDYIWTPNDPADGIDTQVCSRDSSHIGETRLHIFTAVADITAFLNSQPANTAATPYNIKLDVADLPWSTSGAAQNAFRSKYVNLDLSGSTFTSINYNTFNGCTGLTGVTLPASVTSIPNGSSLNGAFSGCANLTSVTFAEGSKLTTIGNNAFYGCSNLTNITIPASVTSIGTEAFRDCTNLTSVTIPASVKTIGTQAFFECTSLASVTIPASVTTIGEMAFENCTGLTSITIPASVTTIGGAVFRGCTSLASVTIPTSVKFIDWGAFNGCFGLTSVTIPASVTSIGEMAFSNAGLTSVTFAGTIDSGSFSSSSSFPGDLRAKYLATNGGPGTYIVTSGTNTFNKVWTKQP